MIHMDTLITDRIPQAAARPHVSKDVVRRMENMRASTAAVKKEKSEMSTIAVRMLGVTDNAALRRLAGRDTATVPAGRLLAAESNGSLVAALSLDDGSVIADPFRESAAAVELLRLRARQLKGSGNGSGKRRFRLPHLPRARGAIAGSPPGGGSKLLQL